MDRGASVCSPFLEGAPLRSAHPLRRPRWRWRCLPLARDATAQASRGGLITYPRAPRGRRRPRAREGRRVARGRRVGGGHHRRRIEDVLHSGRTTDIARAVARCGAGATSRWMPPRATGGTPRLAELVLGDDEDPGVVLAFDVQAAALVDSGAAVDELRRGKASRVRLVLDSHARRAVRRQYVGDDDETTAMTSVDDDDDADAPSSDFTKKKKEKETRSDPLASGGVGVGVACFNLGYLPGADSDKTLVTETASTVRAVRSAVAALRPGGVVTVVGYVGAPAAPRRAAPSRLVAALDPRMFATRAVVRRCPRLIVVHRKRERQTVTRRE